jgi:hypothetical protein
VCQTHGQHFFSDVRKGAFERALSRELTHALSVGSVLSAQEARDPFRNVLCVPDLYVRCGIAQIIAQSRKVRTYNNGSVRYREVRDSALRNLSIRQRNDVGKEEQGADVSVGNKTRERDINVGDLFCLTFESSLKRDFSIFPHSKCPAPPSRRAGNEELHVVAATRCDLAGSLKKNVRPFVKARKAESEHKGLSDVVAIPHSLNVRFRYRRKTRRAMGQFNHFFKETIFNQRLTARGRKDHWHVRDASHRSVKEGRRHSEQFILASWFVINHDDRSTCLDAASAKARNRPEACAHRGDGKLNDHHVWLKLDNLIPGATAWAPPQDSSDS